MTMFLALAALLGTAKLAGEIVQKLGQPSVLGEIFAGILLGPTVLGHFRPDIYAFLFPEQGSLPIVIETVTTLGVVYFLLTAGLEIDLGSIFRQGRSALLVSIFGILIPFGLGFGAAALFPGFLGAAPRANHTVFALFVGTALSVSALPLIAKILMDLNLLRSEMGTVIISSAMFDDLVGWILFSTILGMMHVGVQEGGGAGRTILLVASFVIVTLTLVRWLIDKILPWLQAHTSWPGGVLAFVFTLTLLAAAFAEFAGIHAVFGAFIVGIAVGESTHLRKRTSEQIHQIVTNVFAPFFFAAIGLRTNFISHFDLHLTLVITAVACLGKLAGASLGAHLGGLDRHTSLGIGLAMNARGAMEMILGILALHAGLIRENMFVSLVIMALFTSLISAPSLRLLVQRHRSVSLKDIVTSRLYFPDLEASSRKQALEFMCTAAAEAVSNAPERFLRLTLERERVSPSGWREGLAVPHTRVTGLISPTVVVGRCRSGIDFDARDGKPARLIILILTPDNQSQHDLLSDAGEIFSRSEAIEQAIAANTFLEFAAALNAPVK